MARKPKVRGENWRRRLPRPIVLKKDKPLVILGDCLNYCINELGDYEARRERRLMLAGDAVRNHPVAQQ